MRSKHTIIFLLVLMGSVLGACNKWLDVKPKDKFTEIQLFNDLDGAALTMNGIYLQLANSNLYGRQLSMSTLEILAQRYNIGSSHDELTLQNYNYDDSKAKGKMAGIWQSGYVVIVNANAFIRNLDVYAGPTIPARYDSLLRGEAIGIRAMMHFDLLRMYGPIYNTKDSTAKSIPYYRKAATQIAELLPANQAIDSILADLLTAERLLQADPIISEGVVKYFRTDEKAGLPTGTCA
ncbi:RagB/SusD family nutrient uptake outer membrane protein [Paraflavitalea speifideaquila]|uniref:RagB/SusD family nutrient uptake outer membrane protein n=1 Tax=Paraflavitalea speifideaquila TaxID=3076558 RepID=UPI0028EB94ED|nr:RagB/SusD family nutrient uptake outer membrane protein [Paraflavitalea speifideiaquila]